MLDWEAMFRRYVYDPDKTPYFTSADKLTKVQADNELLVYCLFTAVLFGMAGVAALTGKLPHGSGVGVPIYAFATVWTAILLYWAKPLWAAAACALAPLAALMYLMLYGFHAQQGPIDKAAIVIVLCGWLAYGWRILRIASGYTNMPPGERRRGRRSPLDFLDKK